MPTSWRALGLACTLASMAAAAPQDDTEFVVIRDWQPVGTADTRAIADTLLLSAGSIQTDSAYGDFVFRFDYRLPSGLSRAELLLHADDIGGDHARGYSVSLDGKGGSGQLSATRLELHELRFAARTPRRPDEWTACEVRIARGRLNVSLDGALVAEADRLDPQSGRIGFRAAAGGIELRGMRLALLHKPASTFHPELPKAGDPGITQPQIAKSVPPMYPYSVRARGISGQVLLELVIEADGKVGDLVVVSSPHPDLVDPAIACARKWRFTPATKGGAATAVTATLEVPFNLAPR
jgi:TonB family protein